MHKRLLIDRPELMARLDPERAAVVGIWAPAGFGKTTLTELWADAPGRQRPLVWIDLVDSDNDDARLRSRLRGLSGQEDLGDGEIPPLDSVMTSWHEASGGVDLVLNNVHVLHSPASLAVVDTLCSATPPGSMVVLTSRSEPGLDLDALRVKGRIDEITSADLRFTPREVSELSARRGVDASAAELVTLWERTEGWPAGTMLALQGIRRVGRAGPVLARIGALARHVGGFVETELLEPLPAGLREFVASTAWFDRFCAELCDEVLDRSDSAALLEQLDELQLVVNPPDEEGRWYRYHPLVLECLRSPRCPLPSCERERLHLRAAGWFEREGYPDDSVAHAFASGNYEYAAHQVLRYMHEYDRQGRAHTVRRWLDQLPDHIKREPSAQLGFAWSMIQSGHPLDVLTLLEGAVESPEPATANDVELWLVRSFAQRMLFRHDEVVRSARHALRLIDGVTARPQRRAFLRLMALNQIIDVLAWRHRTDEAQRLLDGARRSVGASGNRLALTRMLGVEALLAADRGQLLLAHRLALDSLSAGKALDLFDHHAATEGTLAEALVVLEQGDTDGSERLLRRALQLAAGNRWPTSNARAMLELATLVGEPESGELIRQVRALNELAGDPVLEGRIELTLALIDARAGNAQASGARLRRLARGPLSSTDRSQVVLVALEAGLADLAIDQAESLTKSTHMPSVQIAAGLACAAAQQGSGRGGQARLCLAEALATAEGNGIRARLVGPLRSLWATLEALPAESAAGEWPSLDYLAAVRQACRPPAELALFSARERDVVLYLPTRLMAEEIAAALYISTNTVKTHLRNIYRKLGVANRNEAASKLERLGRGTQFIRGGG